MKKYINKYLILLVAITGMIPALAFAAPGIPHQFYGTVIYTNGSNVTSGNIIVKIGSTQIISVPISNGRYGYNPNLLLITDPDNNRAGSTLKFYIDSADTGKTATFSNGGYTKLDFSVTSSGGGGGGGGGGGTTYTPPPAVTPSVADITGDSIVNEYDFALLMADWGKTGSSQADLNKDGTVNEYDFALLMFNWSV